MTDPDTQARPDSRRTSSRGAVATVMLWGREVGAVAEDPASGAVLFEYAESFRQSGLEISPIHLPLSRRGPLRFPELARSAEFQGLPGVLADSLPDAFGNAIIRRYFEQRGTPAHSLSPVQKLLYMGQRAMGALEYHPPLQGTRSAATDEALAIAALVEQARHVVEGDTTVAIPEMMQIGASAGGARAKALVLCNSDRSRVRSGFASPEPDEQHWMIKFDGVTAGAGGHDMVREFHPTPWGRIEYAYYRMALRAGLEMFECALLHERDYAHFMTQRFDRVNGTRLHMHSLGGMQHADYNVRQVLSYEEYFRTIRALGLGQPALEQAYRRMVFNVLARNQDDHVKNFAFLMNPKGEWRLAPAYDVTWAVGGLWAHTHQMTVAGKDDNFTRADLLRVGEAFDVRQDGAAILEEVAEAVRSWPEEAASVGLSRREIEMVETTLEARRASL